MPHLIWHHPEPPGRKNALTRAAVVRTAIELADTGGVAALTMRAVADALGVSTPMSLYRYVLNKDGLVDLMLDEVSAEVAVPAEPSGDWRADLRGLATSLWAMIGRHRWYAELVDSRPPFGPDPAARRLRDDRARRRGAPARRRVRLAAGQLRHRDRDERQPGAGDARPVRHPLDRGPPVVRE